MPGLPSVAIRRSGSSERGIAADLESGENPVVIGEPLRPAAQVAPAFRFRDRFRENDLRGDRLESRAGSAEDVIDHADAPTVAALRSGLGEEAVIVFFN